MNFRGMAMAAAALAIGVAALAPTAMKATNAVSATSEKRAGERDLTGYWQLDRSQIEVPRERRNRDGKRGDRPEGAARRDRTRHSEFDGMGRLPAKFRIGTSDRGLAVSDSSGTILQVIMYREAVARDSSATPPIFAGTWDDGRLKVKRMIPEGTMTQTFALSGDGHSLVVRTKIHREHASDFDGKRTFVKVTAP